MANAVFYKASVEKDLRRIDPQEAKRILKKFEIAAQKDADPGESLKGEFQGLYKYRIGDYRVIFTKIPAGPLVLRVSHRRESYR